MLPPEFIDIAHNYYIPLANYLARASQQQSTPFFIAINGCQGSGKSTLTAFLSEFFEQEQHKKVAIISLDDFYYSQQKRNELANNISPLFTTRGVPGTHDHELLRKTLTSLKRGTYPIDLPRFNKATDNPYPRKDWPQISSPVDIVIFEGWCWGIEAQKTEDLAEPVNKLEMNKDADGTWRHYANHALRNHYQSLYPLMDFWLMLQAPSFQTVFQWRLEQENKLAEKLAQKGLQGAMNEAEVQEFVLYYQRLTEHGLQTMPSKADVIFKLDKNRNINEVKGIDIDG